MPPADALFHIGDVRKASLLSIVGIERVFVYDVGHEQLQYGFTYRFTYRFFCFGVGGVA